MRSTPKPSTARKGFTDDEKAAMRERARELKAAATNADGEKDVLAKIAEMPAQDRALAERIHAVIKKSAPGLTSKTWYGMPAYAQDGNVICFFKPAAKFKARYATLGFSDKARLDDGPIWATEFALVEMSAAVEAKVTAMVRQAVS